MGLHSTATTAAAPATVAVTLKDNVVHVVDLAAVAVKTSVRGVRPPVLGTGGKGATAVSSAVDAARVLALQPNTACVAVAAAGASLQFFHPAADRHVSALQVRQRQPPVQCGRWPYSDDHTGTSGRPQPCDADA